MEEELRLITIKPPSWTNAKKLPHRTFGSSHRKAPDGPFAQVNTKVNLNQNSANFRITSKRQEGHNTPLPRNINRY